MQRWQEVGEGWSYFFLEDFLHDSEQQLVLSLVLLGASTMYSTCRGATNHNSEIIATDQSRLRRSPLTNHSSATIVTIINVTCRLGRRPRLKAPSVTFRGTSGGARRARRPSGGTPGREGNPSRGRAPTQTKCFA